MSIIIFESPELPNSETFIMFEGTELLKAETFTIFEGNGDANSRKIHHVRGDSNVKP